MFQWFFHPPIDGGYYVLGQKLTFFASSSHMD